MEATSHEHNLPKQYSRTGDAYQVGHTVSKNGSADSTRGPDLEDRERLQLRTCYEKQLNNHVSSVCTTGLRDCQNPSLPGTITV
jgi:hypothetical protein